jgi:DNA-binding CsgD family transcriptional regulator
VLDDDLVARTVELVASRPLTLIVAAPGAGKTTLATAVAEQAGTVLWVHLDELDDDPSTLLGLLATAGEVSSGCALSSIEPLLAEGLVTVNDVRRAASVLLDDLERCAERRLVIVLDDLHTIRSDEALTLLGYLVEHLPRHVRVLATSRTRPRLPLARLRARQQLGEVGDRDLALDADRATRLLNERLGLGLDRVEVEALVERSSGWVTGIRLLGHPSGGLDDYIDEELLARERPDVARFLTDLAVLDEVSPARAAALTGRDDAAAVLWDLAGRHRLFIETLDQEETEYRYHDLLRSHLLRRLRAVDPGRLSLLHQVAADSAPTSAARIEHLLAAGAWDDAGDAIEEGLDLFSSPSSLHRSAGWLRRLPEHVQRRPRLQLCHGLAAARRGDVAIASSALEAVLPTLEADGDEAAVWLAARALHVATYDHARWVPRLAALERSPGFDALPPSARADHHLSSAYGALFAGDWSAVAHRVDLAVDLTTRTADTGAAESLAQHLSPLLAGVPGVTERVAQYAEWAATRITGSRMVDAGIVHQRAWTSLLLADPAGAAAAVRAGHDVSALLRSFPYLRTTIDWVLVTAAMVDGDHRLAEEILRDGIDIADATPLDVSLDDLRRCQLARLLRRRGDVEGLRRLHGLLALTDAGAGGLDHSRNVRPLVEAQLRWAEGDRRRAERAIDEAVAIQRDERVRPLVGDPRLDLALLLDEHREERRALDVLGEAVASFTAWGTPGLLVTAGPDIVPLLLRLPRGRTVSLALAALDRDAVPAPLAVPGSPEVLSGREVQVLRLLHEGASNQAIAERLHVSTNTAKTHVRNVLRKLGAGSRGQAAAIARSHHLL